MAFQQLGGMGGMWLGIDPGNLCTLPINGAFTSSLIDATGEKHAFVGRVWFKERTSTKAIRRVGFRFGTVTKAGGSALTVSLQDVSLTAGPPGQPDETQDQTVAIANADAGFASNVWYRTGALSADRTVTYGDELAVVIEYDGGGRLGADAVNISCIPWSTPASHLATSALKTGGTWAVVGIVVGNVVLEFSDGTFGTLESCLPISAFNTHSFNSGSAADEFAMPLMTPFPCKIDCLRAFVLPAGATSDFDLVLYQGTTALVTASIDGNRCAASGQRVAEAPIAETQLDANTQYYVSVKPTTTNNVSVYSFDVNDANHLTCYPGGTNLSYTTRVDTGAWAAVTATRRLLVGARISSLSDGVGGTTIAGTPMMRGMVA